MHIRVVIKALPVLNIKPADLIYAAYTLAVRRGDVKEQKNGNTLDRRECIASWLVYMEIDGISPLQALFLDWPISILIIFLFAFNRSALLSIALCTCLFASSTILCSFFIFLLLLHPLLLVWMCFLFCSSRIHCFLSFNFTLFWTLPISLSNALALILQINNFVNNSN